MKQHPEKWHLGINKDCIKKVSTSSSIIGNGKCEKLLEIKFDSKLNFEAHVGDLCKKADP